jgi:hypothetical protein
MHQLILNLALKAGAFVTGRQPPASRLGIANSTVTCVTAGR